MSAPERYELRRLIARGGAADIFEAVEHLGDGRRRPVAIIRLDAQHASDPSFVEGFREQARLIGRLQHPNLVQIYEYGVADGLPFQARELVSGEDLESFIRRAGGAIPEVLAIFIAREVCRALAFLEREGIAHGDLTAEQILISWTGEVKLAPQRGESTGRRLDRLFGPQSSTELAALLNQSIPPAELERRLDALLFARGRRDAREELELWLDALEPAGEEPGPAHPARDLLDLELVLERHEEAAPRFVSRPRAIVEERDAPEVGEHAGDYHLLGALGRGSTATVFRAAHPEHGTVALKILHTKLTRVPRVMRRFLREARALKSVDHPNLVRVIEAGEEDGVLFIATELVEGRTLHRILAKEGPPAPAQAMHIAAQLARGLAAVHARGLVHRDLKPGNVMILDDGRVKLLDFGIAKDITTVGTDTRLTKGGPLGTPGFMSPEQIADPANVGPAADLFSLGRVFEELIEGTVPDPRLAAVSAELRADDPQARPSAAAVAERLDAPLPQPQPQPLPQSQSLPSPRQPKFFRVAMIVLPTAALLATIAIVQSLDHPTPPMPATPAPAVAPLPRAQAAVASSNEDPGVEDRKPPPRAPRATSGDPLRESSAAVTRALEARGLELADLERTPEGREWLARYRSARDPQLTAAALEPLLQNFPITPDLVRARLESISAAIRRETPRLSSAELDALEARYFALRSALTPDAPRERCEELLRAARQLERELPR